MPRKKPLLESFHIKRFTGIETKISSIDQKLGTMRRADGTNVVPMGQVSFGPNWQPAWGLTAVGPQIQAALIGAGVISGVAFVEVSSGFATFLVAWDVTNNRPQGMWQVSGQGNPFSNGQSSVIPTANIHTEKITFTGGTSIARSVGLFLNPEGTVAGDKIIVEAIFPGLQGIPINFYSLSLSGTPIASYTTDGMYLIGAFEFVFTAAGAWEYLTAQIPA